ncbi:MAG TPA: sigma 54-interacting transcriptional regulator [Virgibacillus sp.]|nr:sigma 54-interacting transcriptional regulator [Virgibacillus sp.]
MKQVLIIGAGKSGGVLLKQLMTAKVNVVAIVAITDTDAFPIAHEYDIPTSTNWKKWFQEDLDFIVETTDDDTVFNQLLEMKNHETLIIPAIHTSFFSTLISEKESIIEHLKIKYENKSLLLNHIRDGMVVVNTKGIVQFANSNAEHILNISKQQLENKPIETVIENSRLPHVLRSHQKEINQRLVLQSGRTIITTRLPIFNVEDELVGAFSIFKDITEVKKLAEENTDLKEIKTMLEAIIQSSDEAISVVDQNGYGIMINPAYTRLTGLSEENIIGYPATTDIFEGESMHMKVLETGIPVRGVHMKVGTLRRDVLVNVAPVIVEGKIKGSVGVLHDVSEINSLNQELKKARKIIRNLEAKYTFDDIVGRSPEMELTLEQAKVGAKTPATVLLRGESGTGKELFAHAIHNESKRKDRKFIRFNCSSGSETYLNIELFGREEQSSSRPEKKGLFEEANHGSIFLDEIGELSLNMQAKLLRVLQEGEIVRVGGTKPITVDVRVITATDINLEKAIMERTFREDLYYLLNRLPIFMPPLRERLMDIPVLTEHIIDKMNHEYSRHVDSISKDAISELSNYSWPGNIRELENVIGRAMIYMGSAMNEIQLEHLPNLHVHTVLRDTHLQNQIDIPLQEAVDGFEKEYINRILRQCNYNKTKTAKTLQISIRSLYYKMDKYELEYNE